MGGGVGAVVVEYFDIFYRMPLKSMIIYILSSRFGACSLEEHFWPCTAPVVAVCARGGRGIPEVNLWVVINLSLNAQQQCTALSWLPPAVFPLRPLHSGYQRVPCTLEK